MNYQDERDEVEEAYWRDFLPEELDADWHYAIEEEEQD